MKNWKLLIWKVQLKQQEMKSKKVLVLHSSDELKLIGLQNKIREVRSEQSSGNESILLKLFPLWSEPLPDEIVEAADNKRILDLAVSGPFCDGCYIYCLLQFSFLNSEGIKGLCESRINIIKGTVCLEISDFCFSSKIFRIAEKHEDGNRYWLTDSVWQKLKKEQG